MRIETRKDGSVWVDGRVVRDTAPHLTQAEVSLPAPEPSNVARPEAIADPKAEIP